VIVHQQRRGLVSWC